MARAVSMLCPCCVHVHQPCTNHAPITNRSFALWGGKDTSWWCDNQGSASDGLFFFLVLWSHYERMKMYSSVESLEYSLLFKALVSCAPLVFIDSTMCLPHGRRVLANICNLCVGSARVKMQRPAGGLESCSIGCCHCRQGLRGSIDLRGVIPDLWTLVTTICWWGW